MLWSAERMAPAAAWPTPPAPFGALVTTPVDRLDKPPQLIETGPKPFQRRLQLFLMFGGSPDTVAARLEHAEAIIELQKKVAALLGVPAQSDGGS
jgi:hypothetical protein